MTRRHTLPALLAFIALAGCENEPERAATATTNAQAGPDRLTRTTTKAMCGTPEDRAFAISQVAEESEINAHPDDVYEVATDIAKKGCPNPSR